MKRGQKTSAEQVVLKLRQIEVQTAQGKSLALACKEVEISEQSCYRIALASEYGRYGYRRVTALLQAAGWRVGKDRVQRIWRREGLKVPNRHRPRSRLRLNDGSCVRLRPLHRNQVWSFDFVQAQTHDGRSLRILTLIDEHSRACLALKVARRIDSCGVIEGLADAMCLHGIPEHIRCDNGPEMISKALRRWVARTEPQIQYIAPGSPWENGSCESFNGKLRDAWLRQEIFSSLKEARIVISLWRNTYNRVRPHSSFGYRPPMPISYPDPAFRLPMAATMP
ncbi:hypothetical protein MRF4_14780 [Methylobacterium radiotolerans]